MGKRIILYHPLSPFLMGCDSFALLPAPCSRVLAFEPVPHFRAFLEYNVHINNFQHLVEVKPNVVSEGRDLEFPTSIS